MYVLALYPNGPNDTKPHVSTFSAMPPRSLFSNDVYLRVRYGSINVQEIHRIGESCADFRELVSKVRERLKTDT